MSTSLKSRVGQLEYDLEMARADTRAAEETIREKNGEIAELKDALALLEEEVGPSYSFEEDDEYVAAELLSEMRRLVHRKQYEDAIELADRELPSRYRYAC